MPQKIPFSIGLNTSSTSLKSSISSAIASVGNEVNSIVNGNTYNGTEVILGAVEIDGNFIKDVSLKQAHMPMTVFQSFPVQMPDGTFTMVSDKTSTMDNAGTNCGGLACTLNGGICGCPDNFNEEILNSMIPTVQNFKVGASCSSKFGQQYLQYFYPEIKWNPRAFQLLKSRLLLCAEIVFPLSNTQGKVIRVKMVDEGPVHKVAIDIMGALCMVSSMKDIFLVSGRLNGKNQIIDNTNYSFPFKDSSYDYINGEIKGYGPQAMLNLKKNVKINTAFTSYNGVGKTSEKNKIGHSLVRVKFFVDPSQREKAEKLLKHKLPEDFLKTNYSGDSAEISEAISSKSLMMDNSSIAGKILNAGLRVSNYCRSNNFKYGSDRMLMKAPPETGMQIVAKSVIDCSSAVWWILGEAGLLKNPTKNIPNTTFFRNNFTSSLIEGLYAKEIELSQLQPGDIILWDRHRDSYNHIAIYSSTGKCFDFGNTKRINSSQPVNKGLKDRDPNATCKFWRIVSNNTA